MSMMMRKPQMLAAMLIVALALTGCGQHSAATDQVTKVTDIAVSDARVGTLTGKKDAKGELVSQHATGVLMFGPYVQISPGKYRVVVLGHCEVPTGATFQLDVVHDKAGSTLAKQMISTPEDSAKGVLATLDFDAPNGANDLEVRAMASAEATVTIDGYSIYKLN